ncbi:hypothetical protein DL96DRAFT_1595359 [Flagelloscypha sp. PMI_526]|nr:hypothetical protein DL96DRAFT_1595359 [Flagelloscypha sp. PMI_526]
MVNEEDRRSIGLLENAQCTATVVVEVKLATDHRVDFDPHHLPPWNIPRLLKMNPSSQEHRSNPLVSLPTEILLHICRWCSLSDCFGLRRTCKHIHQITCDKSIWAFYLKESSRIRCLFLNSWPPEELPLRHLEYVCVAQNRFPFLLRSSGQSSAPPEEMNDDVDLVSNCLHPCSTRILTPADNVTTIYSVRLAPGGRYLGMVTANDLRIYDLGCHPGQWLSPRPIASYWCIEQRGAHWVTLMFNEGPNGVLWMWLTVAQLDTPQRESVFEIRDLHSNPKINLLSTLIIPAPHTGGYWPYGFGKIGLSCPMVATVYVWDFTKDTFGVLRADGVSQMSLTSSHIEVYSSQLKGLSIFNYPEESKIPNQAAPGAQETSPSLPPLKSYDWSLEMPLTDPHLLTSSAWTSSYTPPGTDAHFDIIPFGAPNDSQTHFSTVHKELRTVDGLTAPVTTHKGRYCLPTRSVFQNPFACTFPNGERLLWWFDDSKIRFHLSSVVDDDDPGVHGVLFEAHMGGPMLPRTWTGVSLDVGVGRLCVLNGKEVRVVDFVPWTT